MDSKTGHKLTFNLTENEDGGLSLAIEKLLKKEPFVPIDSHSNDN